MTELLETIEKRNLLIDGFDGNGLPWCFSLTAIADEALLGIFEKVCPDAAIAIVAVGGYGRRELGPASDLDFVFLADDSAEEENVRALYRSILTFSTDAGWEIDSALRYPADAPGLDDKSRTALMDARLVVGSDSVYTRFMQSFQETFPHARFLADKRRERLQQRAKHGYTPRKIEFNLKEGAGGLRDYHAANWFRRILGAEKLGHVEIYDYIIAVRNALQVATKRKEDRLLRTRHHEVASLLNLEPQLMYTRLIQAAEVFQEEWRAALHLVRSGRFELAPGVHATEGVVTISPDAVLSDAAQGIFHAVDLELRIPLGSISNSIVGDGPAAADYLTAGARYLRALNRCGVLQALVPAFRDAQYLTSDDPVHEYTVGEHSLVVVERLDSLRENIELSAAWAEADNRVLYLAGLFHDLGKTDTSAPHSVTGEQIAHEMEKRLYLQKHEAEVVSWLVREHLTLARVARTYDLQMPEAPLEIARVCGDQSRLAMLYLLTLADISAVSSDAMTPQMESSIRDLYEKARTIIGAPHIESDPANYRNAALARLRGDPAGDHWSAWLEMMPTHYVIGTPKELFSVHAAYVREARDGRTIVVFENDNKTATTELTICTTDLEKPGLLSRILGVLYAHDSTVHGVRAASTREPHPIALDQITLSYRRGIVPKNLSAAISASLSLCLRDEAQLHNLLREKHKDPDQKQHFLTYRFLPGDPSVIEFETPIGRGMPYRVTKMLAKFEWNVQVARVGQWAGRAISRFYVSKPGGILSEEDVASAIENYRRGNDN
jgi:[protein-PII] uridylyltransferase